MRKSLLLITAILTQITFTGCESKTNGYSQEEITEIRKSTPYLKPTTENKKASQFLIRSTFGPSKKEIESLSIDNDFGNWIEKQMEIPPTHLIDWAHANIKGIEGIPDLNTDTNLWREYELGFRNMKKDAWWSVVVNANDQLRQRTAFALSEIFVISHTTLRQYPAGRMHFYDGLVDLSFGNFKDIMEFATFHPMMGLYLTYVFNKKADTVKGTTPDENFARELLQLFTIGLYELNIDGTHKLDENNRPIPTYYQNDIEELARVFTGLDISSAYKSWEGQTNPMHAVESIHDTGDKTVMGNIIQGTDTKTEIRNFLGSLFNHPNVGPFIAKRLIQRLVTSNPTPDYVQAVAEVFNDNGEGIRGDMGAVIKTILLYNTNNDPSHTFGKLREPVLFISHLLRALEAKEGYTKITSDGTPLFSYNSFNFKNIEYLNQENSMEAPSVFNYFRPEDGPFELLNQGVLAPEFKVFNSGVHQSLMSIINQDEYYRNKRINADLDTINETTLAEYGLGEELIDHLDVLLTGGQLTNETKTEILTYFKSNQHEESEDLANFIIGLITTSPDFAIQQ